MACHPTDKSVILPTNKQKRFAYDISNLLGYPLPKNTLGEYAKFIANHTEEYYIKRGKVLSKLTNSEKELIQGKNPTPSNIKEYIPDKNGKYVLQEVSSRLRLQNVRPRMSDCALTSVQEITDFIKKQQKNIDCEQMLIINLDSRKLPINLCQIASGSLDAIVASRQEIFKTAILSNAASIIIYHSTPTLNVIPTWFDNALAASIKASGELLGIPLEHYIIVSMNESYTCT